MQHSSNLRWHGEKQRSYLSPALIGCSRGSVTNHNVGYIRMLVNLILHPIRDVYIYPGDSLIKPQKTTLTVVRDLYAAGGWNFNMSSMAIMKDTKSTKAKVE